MIRIIGALALVLAMMSGPAFADETAQASKELSVGVVAAEVDAVVRSGPLAACSVGAATGAVASSFVGFLDFGLSSLAGCVGGVWYWYNDGWW